MSLTSRLTTKRLILRNWTDADRDSFAEMNADSRVMEHFPSVWTRETSDRVMNDLRDNINEYGWGFWAVEEIVTKDLVGFVGIRVPGHDLPFNPCVEVGWRLHVRHWGKGYATEAAWASLRYGFDVVGLDEIVSMTSIHNHRSEAVMQRLGMVKDAATFEHPALPEGHHLREHVLYRIVKGSILSR